MTGKTKYESTITTDLIKLRIFNWEFVIRKVLNTTRDLNELLEWLNTENNSTSSIKKED